MLVVQLSGQDISKLSLFISFSHVGRSSACLPLNIGFTEAPGFFPVHPASA